MEKKKKITLKEKDSVILNCEGNRIEFDRSDRHKWAICEKLRIDKYLDVLDNAPTTHLCLYQLTEKGVSIIEEGGFMKKKCKIIRISIMSWVVFLISICTFALVLCQFIEEH
jgi:phage gp45-like